LYTYACATNIQYLDINKSISGVTIKNSTGRSHTVKAKYYILACNAIQNPRLLLASNDVSKNGLGNDFDNVGRYFMDHLEIKSAELWLKNPDKLELYSLSGKPRAEIAIHAEQQKKYRILNGTVSLSLLEKVKDVKPAIETWSDDDPRKSQDKLHDAYKQKELSWFSELSTDLYKGYELFTRIEQYPNPACRVSLINERDSLGVPRAHLHWELSDMEKRSIRKIYELIGQQFGKHNIGRLKIMDYLIHETEHSWPSFTGGGWHHMGTTRMHEDPKKGIVDSTCKVHGINNLFIAGSSCFTTGGAVNPTLTIVALSIRLADHLKDKMKSIQ
jgi:choline dehydrogenase-like flavoprotein